MEKIIKAQRRDKQRVLDILTEAFWNDPHINWFTGQGTQKKNRIRAMMSHAFEGALARGDVYMSPNKEAVAIWRNSSKQVVNIYTIWENLKFLYHFGFNKVKAISALDERVHQGYPKEKAFYYLFIIGTSEKGRGKGLSSLLMNTILQEADQKGLPTYLETANHGNIPIYNRKGFQVYKELPVAGEQPITISMLVRKPQKKLA